MNNKTRRLLAFNITGVKELNNLTINLVTEGQKTTYDKDVELHEQSNGLFTNKLNFIYGKNASGKTNLLSLIDAVDDIATYDNHIVTYPFYNPEEDKVIKLTALYDIFGRIYKQVVSFTLSKYVTDYYGKTVTSWRLDYDIDKTLVYENNNEYISVESITEKLLKSNDNFRSLSYINDETLGMTKAMSLNKFALNVKMDLIQNLYDGNPSKEQEYQINYIMSDSKPHLLIPMDLPSEYVGNRLINDNNDIMKFVSVFDTQIKSLYFDNQRKVFEVKFKNGKEVFDPNISNIISTGTNRGIHTLYAIKNAIEWGFDVFIDEIEANFNHKIVQFIVDLFMDNTINKKGSRLFASTHYLKTLDFTKRRDGIFLSEREKGKQNINKLNNIDDENVLKNKNRKDVKNSKLVSNIYSLDIEPGLKESIEFKELFK